MTRLSKFDAERLMNDYDLDAVAALTTALAKVLDRPGASWSELLEAGPFTPDRRRLLQARDTAALDGLARQLNEDRSI